MSQGRPIALEDAEQVAAGIVRELRDACERIEIAGSIRRGKATVSDVELVAIPRVVGEQRGLWGDTVQVDALAQRLGELREWSILVPRDVEVHRRDGSVESQQRVGRSYQALETADGVPVDLFIVHDPDQWGVIFTIRTGPAEWSHRLVTDCQRYLRRVEGGYLYRSGQRVPCREERDFFRGIGQAWVEPRDRRASCVAITAMET